MKIRSSLNEVIEAKENFDVNLWDELIRRLEVDFDVEFYLAVFHVFKVEIEIFSINILYFISRC